MDLLPAMTITRRTPIAAAIGEREAIWIITLPIPIRSPIIISTRPKAAKMYKPITSTTILVTILMTDVFDYSAI